MDSGSGSFRHFICVPGSDHITNLKTTGAVGFRVDAVKHIDRVFLLDWVGSILYSTCDPCLQSDGI